jgi:hypothetical protein
LHLFPYRGIVFIAGAEANPSESKGKAYEYNYNNTYVGSDCYFFNCVVRDLHGERKEIAAPKARLLHKH